MSKVADTSALMSGTVNAQVLLSYTSDPAATTVDLVVTAGDQSANATYNPGSLTIGDALSPSMSTTRRSRAGRASCRARAASTSAACSPSRR